MERVVVVGAGLAGHRTATALRKRGYAGGLVVIGDEAHRPYDRPPLSKQVLAGEREPAEVFLKPDDLDVDWRLGVAATGLDLERSAVRLADGGAVPYDRVVIATGRRARAWHEPVDLAGVHVLRSLDDCVAFRDATGPDRRVVIVGAGFVGCEVAATLRARGVGSVTVLEAAGQPMGPLGAEVGAWLAAAHRERGVDLRVGVGVEGFEGDGRVSGVRLAGGERLPADVVLLALGSAPNTEWLADSGLARFHGAVRCDATLFAEGRDDVLAIGDVAAWPHPAAGGPVWVEHWTNARESAAHAAANLLGDPPEREPFAPVPTFWSDQLGLRINSTGFLGQADRFAIVEQDPAKPSLVAEAFAGDELVGAVGVNAVRAIVGYTRTLGERFAAGGPS